MKDRAIHILEFLLEKIDFGLLIPAAIFVYYGKEEGMRWAGVAMVWVAFRGYKRS